MIFEHRFRVGFLANNFLIFFFVEFLPLLTPDLNIHTQEINKSIPIYN